jgi:hypothetical protein
MPNTPQGAYSPSDDELDDLIEESGAADDTPDPAPEAPSSAPSGEPAGNRTDEDPANAVAGAHDEDDEPQRQPEGEPTGEEDGAPTAAAEAPPAAPPAGSKPFQVKAAGGEHTLAGAFELQDGSVVIAKDAQPEFRRFVASAVELQKNFTQLRRNSQRQIQALTQAQTDRDLESGIIVDEWKKLLALSPEERWKYLQEMEQEAPTIQTAIERKKLDRDREQLKREREGPPLLDEEKEEQVQQLATNELAGTFSTLSQHEDAKLFTQEELKALWGKWAKRAQRLVRTATEDGNGWKKGQTVFDDTEVWEDFALLADVKKKAAAKAGPTGAQARNAALNADQTGKTRIPPVVTPTRPAAGDGRKKQPSFAGNKKGFQKAFMAGDLDDAE